MASGGSQRLLRLQQFMIVNSRLDDVGAMKEGLDRVGRANSLELAALIDAKSSAKSSAKSA